MNKEKLILIGGGGHCRSCIDVIELENKFEIAGILDIHDKVGEIILDYSIIGTDEDIPQLIQKYSYFFITIGQIRSAEARIRVFNVLKRVGAKLPVIVSPKTHVSKHSAIHEGTIVMHAAVVNANAVIGENCIINSKALIEHETIIGSNTHISTGAIINGQCRIGNNCFIGSGATIANNITIADNVIIGAGSYVGKDIMEAGIYLGNPARKVKV